MPNLNQNQEVTMSDPFQDVDSAGIEFAEATAKTMEIRQSEPTMEKIVNDMKCDETIKR